jgi:glycosyltransferase involved in cell wall biosynthesis
VTGRFWLDCALGTSAFVVVLYAMLAFRLRRVPFLRDVAEPRGAATSSAPPGSRSPDPATPSRAARPRVTIVAPALNEARGIEPAVRGFAAQRGLDLELIVVDDRSTDATPAILARLAGELPVLRVLTVRDLPSGWLGKNHANALGAAAARGDWLLFTDADVTLAPDAVARAVAYAETRGFDHVAIAPQIVLPGAWLQQFVLYFGLMFALYLRPWAASDPHSRAHVGIGPFNLVRASAYRRAGGHAPLRLRPDDDLKLGKVLKRHGARQAFVAGQGLVTLPWYGSWRELRDGLMKNLYAGVEYRTVLVVFGAAAHVLGLALPPLALLFADGLALWLQIANWALFAVAGALVARGFGTAWWAGAVLPFWALAGAWLMVRSTALALWRGGIEWRGTTYPLAQLRANVV